MIVIVSYLATKQNKTKQNKNERENLQSYIFLEFGEKVEKLVYFQQKSVKSIFVNLTWSAIFDINGTILISMVLFWYQ